MDKAVVRRHSQHAVTAPSLRLRLSIPIRDVLRHHLKMVKGIGYAPLDISYGNAGLIMPVWQ
jgi:hypothetical protein